MIDMMNFKIIKANLMDLGNLQHLENICFPDDAWPIFDLVAVLTFPEVIRLKAVKGKQMVGFIAGDIRHSEELAWIATLAVNPEHQKQGIGSALLRECEMKISVSRVRLCLRPSNKQAMRLYEKAGYEEIDIWKAYYNDKGDALVMEKRIA